MGRPDFKSGGMHAGVFGRFDSYLFRHSFPADSSEPEREISLESVLYIQADLPHLPLVIPFDLGIRMTA